MSSEGGKPPEEAKGEADPYSDAAARFGPLKLPTLQPDIDIGSVASVYGVQGQHSEPEYLDFNIKGRDWYEKLPYNAGVCYLGGIASGGAYGLVEGYRGAPSSKGRVVMNSVLNAAGKRGSRLGNGMAVVAMYYTMVEHVLDRAEVDQHLGGFEFATPVLAAASTGMLYKCTAGPRVALLAGAVGAVGAGVLTLGSRLVSRQTSGGRSRGMPAY